MLGAMVGTGSVVVVDSPSTGASVESTASEVVAATGFADGPAVRKVSQSVGRPWRKFPESIYAQDVSRNAAQGIQRSTR